MSDKEVYKVKDYMHKQNRPYSLNDLFLNLHKEIGKTGLQKCLDHLVEAGSATEKTYGKQKVYVINQSQFPSVSDAELRALEREVSSLTEDIRIKDGELSQKESYLKSLLSSCTTEDALSQIEQISTECSQLEEKLQNLQSNSNVISDEERKSITDIRKKSLSEWRKRRRIARDILDSILEGYPNTKKELYEEIGIESDEAVGVKMPES